MAADSRLFVGNLADQVTEDLLYELFLQVGPVEKVTRPHRSGQLAKFAFVDFVHPESVNYAIQVVKGVKLFGEELWLKGPNDNRNSYAQPASRSPSHDPSHRLRSSVSPCSSQGSHASTSRGRPDTASGSGSMTANQSDRNQNRSRSNSRDRSYHRDRSHHRSGRSRHSPEQSRRHPDRSNHRPDRSHERYDRSRHARDRSHRNHDRDRSHHRYSHRNRSCHDDDRSRSEEDGKQRNVPSSCTAFPSERESNNEMHDSSADELKRSQPVHHSQKEQLDVPHSAYEAGPQGDHPPCPLDSFPMNTSKQLDNQDFMKKTAIYRWSASDKKQ